MSTAIVFLVLTSVYILYRVRRKLSSGLKYPPGPPAIWVIGNIMKIPIKAAWKDFTMYKRKYGDLVFFYGLGNRVLVLNNLNSIMDLLDKRADNYSDRPVFTVVGELMGLDQSVPLLPYGKEWREHRKLAHTALSPGSVRKYWKIQENFASSLAQLLLDNPTDFFSHVRLTAGRVILAITYGLSIEDVDNIYIAHAEKTMEMIGRATIPGAYLCDLLPIFKYLPTWVPFHREAKVGRQMIESLVTMPFEHVKRDIKSGTASVSLTEHLLKASKNDPETENRIKWTTGALYGAGGETTYATVLTFIMTMALYPEVQRKAQEEIDSVVGLAHLPSLSDKESLPYLNAVIKEVMRWHPALPLSIARQSSRDDTYEGYFIPKGTIVIPNVWAVASEANSVYDTKSFLPERFLDEKGRRIDPDSWAFGFGRRVCPGRYLGSDTIFILVSTIISCFDILPPVEGELKPKFGKNLVSYPEPFIVRFLPRSEAKVEAITLRGMEN